jgi:hypothetical protein
LIIAAGSWPEVHEGVASLASRTVLITTQQKRLARGCVLPGYPVYPQLPSVGETYREVKRNLVDVYVTGVAIKIVPKEREVELAFAQSASRKGIEQPRAAEHSWRFLSLGQIAVMTLLCKDSPRQHQQHHDKRAYLSSRFHYFAS